MSLSHTTPMGTATWSRRKAAGGPASASPLPGHGPATPEGLLTLRAARKPTLVGQRTNNVRLRQKEPHPPHGAQGLLQPATPHLLEYAGCRRLQGPVPGGLQVPCQEGSISMVCSPARYHSNKTCWGPRLSTPNCPSHEVLQPPLGPPRGTVLLGVRTCNTAFFSPQDSCDSLPMTVAQPDSFHCTRLQATRCRDEGPHLPGLPPVEERVPRAGVQPGALWKCQLSLTRVGG